MARRVRHKSGAFRGAGQYELTEINGAPFALERSLIGAQRSGKSEFSEYSPAKNINRRKNFMCTAATYKTKDFYFGRTLDYDISYGDRVTVTPRNYVFHLRNGEQLKDRKSVGRERVC